MTTQLPWKYDVQPFPLLDLSVSCKFSTLSSVRHYQTLLKGTVCAYRGFMSALESETIVLITPEPEKLYSHIDVSFKRNKLTYLTPVSCCEKLCLINQILVYTSLASLVNIVFTCISRKLKVFSLKIITCCTSRTGILESGKSQDPVSPLCCKRLPEG